MYILFSTLKNFVSIRHDPLPFYACHVPSKYLNGFSVVVKFKSNQIFLLYYLVLFQYKFWPMLGQEGNFGRIMKYQTIWKLKKAFFNI